MPNIKLTSQFSDSDDGDDTNDVSKELLNHVKQLTQKYNFVCFPLKAEKKPDVNEWQKLTKTAISAFKKSTTAYGIQCGKNSNITVIDIDNGSRFNEMLDYFDPEGTINETAVRVKTPTGGYHYIFQYEESVKTLTGAVTFYDKGLKVRSYIDTRNDGGYIVGAKSLYSASNFEKEMFNGKPYKWEIDMDDVEGVPTEMPDWLLKIVTGWELHQDAQGEFEIKEKPVIIKKTTQTSSEYSMSREKAEFVIDNVGATRATERSDWIKGVWAIASLGEEWGLDLAERFSMRTLSGNFGGFEKVYDQSHDKITFGTMIHWLEIDNPTAFMQFKQMDRGLSVDEIAETAAFMKGMPVHEIIIDAEDSDEDSDEEDSNEDSDEEEKDEKYSHSETSEGHDNDIKKSKMAYKLLTEGNSGWCKLYCLTRKNDVVITDIERDEGYMWNDEKKLWIKSSRAILIADIQSVLEVITLKAYTTAKESKKKELSVILKQTQMVKHPKDTYQLVKCKLYREKFEETMNSSVFEVPIAGGKVIDVKTGVQRNRIQTDYFDAELKVKPVKQVSEKVTKFIREICANDESLVGYLQERLGLCLSGMNERLIYIAHGEGNNGKTTLLRLVAMVLDEYAGTLSAGALMSDNTNGKRNNKNQATLALNGIIGKRFVLCDESDEKERLDSVAVKSLANEEGIMRLRENYGKFANYNIYCKTFLSTNKIPDYDKTDAALVKRLRFIPFNVRFFDESKKEDKEKLREKNPNYKIANRSLVDDIRKNHLNDFFTWMIQGSIRYFTHGGSEPDIIFNNKESIETQKDTVKRFVKECIAFDTKDVDENTIYLAGNETSDSNFRERTNSVYDRYIRWLKDECSEVPEKKGDFYKRLGDLKVLSSKVKGERMFRLKNVQEETTSFGEELLE